MGLYGLFAEVRVQTRVLSIVLRLAARQTRPSSPFPAPFWLPQSPQWNRTLPMNRLAKDLGPSAALICRTTAGHGAEPASTLSANMRCLVVGYNHGHTPGRRITLGGTRRAETRLHHWGIRTLACAWPSRSSRSRMATWIRTCGWRRKQPDRRRSKRPISSACRKPLIGAGFTSKPAAMPCPSREIHRLPFRPGQATQHVDLGRLPGEGRG